MKKTEKSNIKATNGSGSFPIGLGFCSVSADANSSVVDVKDGRIIRIRPLHYDWKYRPEDFGPWLARGLGWAILIYIFAAWPVAVFLEIVSPGG